jgi:hypothetical protein
VRELPLSFQSGEDVAHRQIRIAIEESEDDT